MTPLAAMLRASRLLDVPAVLELLRFRQLRQRYYARFWRTAAREAGADCESWDYGLTRISRGGLTVIARLSELRLDDRLTLDLMGNKFLTYKLMAEQGCEVPRHVRFSPGDLSPALALLETSGRPLVVKPLSGTGGGNGVTTGITEPFGLRKAAWLAQRFGGELLAEEQIEGHCYRLLFLDGEYIDAVRRDPPRLTGDGTSSIRSLRAKENRRRLAGEPFWALSPLRLDRDARNYLKAQGLSTFSVPGDGQVVVVKRAVNENTAAENHAVRDSVHPATIAEASRLAVNLGVRLAGFDVYAHDIAKPLGSGNGLIGEINTTPGLHHHDLVSGRGAGQSVAARILDHLFATRVGVIRSGRTRPAPLRKVAG